MRLTGREDKDTVALLDADLPQHVGEAVRERGELLVGELLGAVLIGIDQGELVAAPLAQVAVDGLVRHIHLARLMPVELRVNRLPLEILVGLLVVLQVVEIGGIHRLQCLGFPVGS